ncbi:MAG: hypothetical protein EBS87_12335 [Sphingomonadaceae bacterium]|nr:hypothetical protein [Sphingomonadaceae bacterium]
MKTATELAQQIADQELEACCEWLKEQGTHNLAEQLEYARRPKPPSLKEQALKALQHAEEGWRPVPADCDLIRRALERLQELEGQQ